MIGLRSGDLILSNRSQNLTDFSLQRTERQGLRNAVVTDVFRTAGDDYYRPLGE
jgi:hypothetical protein